MKKTGIFMAIAAFLAMVCLGVAWADWPDYCMGRPQFTPGKSYGYFIWKVDCWHLRTSTKEERKVFEGTISSDQDITIVHRDNMEPDNGDFVTRVSNNQIMFRLTTEGDEDGFGFNTNGKYLIFDLKRDGVHVWTEHITVGDDNWHPSSNPFVTTQQ
ncbi:MAG: hypothetical protein RDV48_18215 [Candidatus Eremiobacteraeota bacterium]|nr:hypothetical protein [Candidatus Eremiobacteraeota bacterium]